MIALIQRVSRAAVVVEDREVARIDRGILALIGIETGDTDQTASELLGRILRYRIFADEAGKMNLNIGQIDGKLLLVPQFTLVADTHKGMRPGFSRAAPPEVAQRLFEQLVSTAAARHGGVASGAFGAHMLVELVNDGPVTFWMRS